EEEEDGFLPPVALTLERLGQKLGNPQQEIEEELEQLGYDPVQRFNIYLEAAQTLLKMALSADEARRMKVMLKMMMAEIFKKKRHEIRRLMHDADELEAAITLILGTQGAEAAAVTRRELRRVFRPGQMRVTRDRVDVPLKALS